MRYALATRNVVAAGDGGGGRRRHAEWRIRVGSAQSAAIREHSRLHCSRGRYADSVFDITVCRRPSHSATTSHTALIGAATNAIELTARPAADIAA